MKFLCSLVKTDLGIFSLVFTVIMLVTVMGSPMAYWRVTQKVVPPNEGDYHRTDFRAFLQGVRRGGGGRAFGGGCDECFFVWTETG